MQTATLLPSALRPEPPAGSIAAHRLRPILRPDNGIAVWERGVPPDLVPVVTAALAGPAFVQMAEGPPEAAAGLLVDALRGVLPGADALRDDLAGLAGLFAGLTGGDAVRLRLEQVTDDSCRCFHVDNVGLRLLCTYGGLGTEWRDADGRVRRVAAGAVLLLKGAAFPDAAPRVPHRSPPIEHLPTEGRARLLLVADEPGVF